MAEAVSHSSVKLATGILCCLNLCLVHVDIEAHFYRRKGDSEPAFRTTHRDDVLQRVFSSVFMSP